MSRNATSIRHLLVLVSLTFLLSTAPLAKPLLAQESDPKMQLLAQELAQKIGKKIASTKNAKARTTYVVFDFLEPDGKSSQLGAHLADEFSEALTNQLPELKQIERSKLRDLCERERFDFSKFETDKLGVWAANEIGADQVIFGTIEPKDAAFLLHVRVIDNEEKQITDAGEVLDWTAERNAWHRQPAERLPPVAEWKDVPRLGSLKGGSEPVCIECRIPAYTDAARKAKFQGTVITRVLVGEDGLVHGVVVMQGLPYGLSASTVEAVKKYKFKPVLGPDGKPVELQLDIETTFRVT